MLSPSARLSQLFELIARTLALRLCQDIPDWRDVLPEKAFVYQKHSGVLDAHVCLRLLSSAPAFAEPIKGMRHDIATVERMRNRWAHQEPVSHDNVETAIKAVASFMDAIGERVACEVALAFQSKNFEYSNSIRRVLERQAKNGCETITYSRACDLLKLSSSQGDRNLLYRQLTALGILQKASGEPQLCSLVVLGENDNGVSDTYPIGMPGSGYYWLIDVDARASLDVRRTRWFLEIGALKHTWATRA